MRRLGVGTLVAQQLEAARAAKDWLRQDMLPGDWVAVVGYDAKLSVYQDFTQDSRALERAVETALKGKDPGTEWPSRRADLLDPRPALTDDLPVGKALGKATRNRYDALRILAEATQDILGRKNLLLFSIGFGELDPVAGGQVVAKPDDRYYWGLREALNDSNVAVYPIDLTPAETDHLQSNFLQQLAADTGGRYWEHFVNFRTPMNEIGDETNGYYLLSYQTEHPAGETGYRAVKVRLENPRLQVRARQGYLYGTEEDPRTSG